MIVLIDTDVLIDVALGSQDFVEPASALLDVLEQREALGYVAWHSISNFYYLVRPNRGAADAKQFVLDLLSFVEVAPASTQSVRSAASMDMSDFEDALQVAAAMACRADVIATRNVIDYSKSPVRAVLPAQAASMIAAGVPPRLSQ